QPDSHPHPTRRSSDLLGTMALTMFCLTLVVFFMVNLEPNLRKLSISQLDMRSSDQDIEQWLVRNGYRDNFFVRYGRWLGVVEKQDRKSTRLNSSHVKI